MVYFQANFNLKRYHCFAKSATFLIFLFAIPFHPPTVSGGLLGTKLYVGEAQRKKWEVNARNQRGWHIYSIWSEVGEEGNAENFVSLKISYQPQHVVKVSYSP